MFLFPKTESKVLPDPSKFFAPHLLSSPLPTNSFFQNFVLENGDRPEYIHPYLIKSSNSSLTLCYPSQLFKNPAYIYQIPSDDLVISTSSSPDPPKPHVISSFSHLSVTLDFPSSNLRFYLVRGSPFLTCDVMTSNNVALLLSSVHPIVELTPNSSSTKYKIKMNNNQTWLLYASSSITLSLDSNSNNKISSSSVYSGVISIAAVPDSDPKLEAVLDKYSSCYPVSGDAELTKPFCLEYKWDKRGSGDLLMLAHPLHLQLLLSGSISVLPNFKYNSIDGELIGVVGDSWALKTGPVSVTWHSARGFDEESYTEIIDALRKDVDSLDSSEMSTSSSYFYGKLIARAARLALIADEVSYVGVIPAIMRFLKDTIEPWLKGTFGSNGFMHDPKWGGIITEQGSSDSQADFGFGIYNDHHYHLGYFIYAIAVLAKIDDDWGSEYKPQAYSLMADYMNIGKPADSSYTRLRCFDLWKLHSWTSGLTQFQDGRNQESPSQALNAYYSAALLGYAYDDGDVVSIGSTLSALEIQAAKMWSHVRDGDTLYPQEFTKENRVMGVFWANKRDSGLWFAPPEWKECRFGIHLMPILPISQALFSNERFARELVEWAMSALGRDGVEERWKGFVYALQGVYDKNGALDNIRRLKGFDDGSSLTNLLWWTHSRYD